MNQRGRSLSDIATAVRRPGSRSRAAVLPSRPRRIRIGVVDDHEIVRRGLRAALEHEPDLEVVADVRTGQEAVKLVEQFRPDVMLVDMRLEDTDGPSVCERLRAVAPETAVVMLTSYHQDGMVLQLKRMIRAAHRGECVLDPAVAPHVIAAATGAGSGSNTASVKKTLALSDIDLDVVRHLASGLTNKQIGALVHRSPHTVKDHLEKICAALEVHTRTEVVAAALRIGLI
ncbi:MAG: response regulator transcription factor [Candidatus Rokuibacteriota bacterium]|nr:MAG: response regulator transcription factor [Candidatus Rokubacteria bacterium]